MRTRPDAKENHPMYILRTGHPWIRTARPSRLVLMSAATLVLLTLLPSGGWAQRVSAASHPTIVLVHGAWAGPAGWSEVASLLRKDGYETSTPTLGLLSSYADVATVRAALDAIRGDKILVGHSYGGSVTSQAAAGRADVRGLVYTAAFVPDAGQSLIALAAGYQPPAALQPGHLIFAGEPFASPSLIAQEFFRADFAADLNPKLAAQLSDQQVATRFGLFFEPAGPVAWRTLPTWYAVSGLDRMVDPALQRALATRIGATTVTFDEASHAGGFTHYATRFVKLVERAAAATTN
jgi:pimeloyl-ACP methyl ester carboxylesterase